MRKSFKLIEVSVVGEIGETNTKPHPEILAVVEKAKEDAKILSVTKQKEVLVFTFVAKRELEHNDITHTIRSALPRTYNLSLKEHGLVQAWKHSLRFVCENSTDTIDILFYHQGRNVLVVLKRDAPQQ